MSVRIAKCNAAIIGGSVEEHEKACPWCRVVDLTRACGSLSDLLHELDKRGQLNLTRHQERQWTRVTAIIQTRGYWGVERKRYETDSKSE